MPNKKDHKDKVFKIQRDGLACLLLVAAILISYWQVTGCEFVNFDDDLYITDNSHVKAGLTPESIKWSLTATDSGNWHPLTWLSHMLDVQIFGMNAGRHHLTSLIFHMANSLLLFLVLKRMTGTFWQSFLVAALFALHPLNVESVAWVSERKNVLSTFFWILTMGSYALYVEQPNAVRYLPVFLLLMLGLAAKPMLVTLPFVLILLDYWPFGRFQFKDTGAVINHQQKAVVFHLVWEKIPLFVLTAISSAVTFYAEKQGGSVSSLDIIPLKARISNALVSYVNYLEKMIWPADMAALYPHPGMLPWWKVAGACLVIVCISYLAIRVIRQMPYVAVGWLWYVGTLVPVIGLVQVGSQSMADRYMYVPLIGIFIITSGAVAELSARLPHRRIWLAALATVVLSTLIAATWKQVRYWKNSITLFEHAGAVTDYNFIMHNNLGLALGKQGKAVEAVSHFNEALRLNPKFVEAYNSLGVALIRMGKIDEAIARFQEAVQLNPDFANTHVNLGGALIKLGRVNEAMVHFRKALQIKPDIPEVHINLGVAFANMGKVEKAIAHFRKALQIDPDNAEALSNLNKTLAALKEIDANIEKIQQDLKQKPDDPGLYFHLGDMYKMKGDLDRAEDYYQKAIELQPDFIEACYHLAKLYIERVEYKKALSLYQKMLDLLPDNPAVYYNIACIYARQNKPEASVSWLQKAVAKGFDDWEHIKTDSDLDNIRDASEFQIFLKGH